MSRDYYVFDICPDTIEKVLNEGYLPQHFPLANDFSESAFGTFLEALEYVIETEVSCQIENGRILKSTSLVDVFKSRWRASVNSVIRGLWNIMEECAYKHLDDAEAHECRVGYSYAFAILQAEFNKQRDQLMLGLIQTVLEDPKTEEVE